MKTSGIAQTPLDYLGTVSWRAKGVEVWVQAGRVEKLIGIMRTNREENAFCGTLSEYLGVLPTSVTADSEDACVLRMVAKWRELDEEENRKQMVLRKDLAAGGEL